MKKALILIFLLIPAMAQAKIKLCEDKCTPLQIEHVHTIKGFLYEIVSNQTLEIKKELSPKFARAIVWLEKIHKDKAMHVITKHKTEDAKFVTSAVNIIVDVAMGRIPNMPAQQTITRWTDLGSKVVARYKTTKHGKKTTVKWKLELSKK